MHNTSAKYAVKTVKMLKTLFNNAIQELNTRPLVTRYLPIIAALFYACAILNPFRALPLASWISESLAFAALIVAGLALWTRSIQIPRRVLPLLLIILIPLVQYLFGQIVYLQTVVGAVMYLAALFAAIVIGYNLHYQSTRLLIFGTVFAVGVVSSVLAILQWLHLDSGSSLILNLSGNRPYANLGQPNHLGTLLLCSSAAACYLYEARVWQQPRQYLSVVVGQVLIIIGLVLTQSRTAWLGSVALLALLWMYRRFNRLQYRYIAAWFGLYLALALLLPEVDSWMVTPHSGGAPISDVVARASSGYERLNMWNQLYHAVLMKPWLGWGWYQTTLAQYAVVHDYAGMEWYTSGHDLWLDLMVWCGIIGGSAICAYLLYLICTNLRAITSHEAVAAAAMVIVMLIHALLEYPLYYSYFLIVFGLMLGIGLQSAEGHHYRLPTMVQRCGLVIGAAVLIYSVQQYRQLEQMSHVQRAAEARQGLYVFDQLAAKAAWQAMPLDEAWLAQHWTPARDQAARQVLGHYLTAYNLKKYAAILVAQQQYRAAQCHIELLHSMYGQTVTLDDLRLGAVRNPIHLDQRIAR